jgi:hypothetical protein
VLPNPGKDPLEPPWGAITIVMQLIIPYSKPFRRPLNYPKYNKDSNLDAHVQVFKATIKSNGENIDEEIANLFNFHWKTTHLISVTIICKIIPIIDLQI